VPDPVCPRCGVPLVDQPDACWSCGFYVGDRWRTTQLGEGDSVGGRLVSAAHAPDDLRVVSDLDAADAAMSRRSIWAAIAAGIVLLVGFLLVAALASTGSANPAASTIDGQGPGGSSPVVAGSSGVVAGGASTATPGGSAAPYPIAPRGETTEAIVTRVVDGDTIVVEIDGEPFDVRYIGMDTPESVKPDTPVEPMAEEAAAANHEIVDGRVVLLERDVSDTDQYGRLLRNVWVDRDGVLVMVGLELVREGFAQVSTFPPDVMYVDQLLAAQEAARADGLGLWGAP
jgi:endonuclease YncB( thermonuclease family)